MYRFLKTLFVMTTLMVVTPVFADETVQAPLEQIPTAVTLQLEKKPQKPVDDGEAALVLFSFEEAEQLNYASVSRTGSPDLEGDDESLMGAMEMSMEELNTDSASSVNGPSIVFEKPLPSQSAMIETGSPTALIISFGSKEADVDMSTLKIQATKGMFSKSLTPLIKPYLQGTRLEADKIEVPTGNFRIEISVADKNGNITRNVYGLTVTK